MNRGENAKSNVQIVGKPCWAWVFANHKIATCRDSKVHEGICECVLFTSGR